MDIVVGLGQVVVVLALAPLLNGFIKGLKARVQMRLPVAWETESALNLWPGRAAGYWWMVELCARRCFPVGVTIADGYVVRARSQFVATRGCARNANNARHSLAFPSRIFHKSS